MLLGAALPRAGATVALAPLFGSNMVLQRGKPVPVSGTASPNKSVGVTFNGQTKTTTSDASGNWQVVLDAMVVLVTGADLTATEAGTTPVTLNNVVVGDVWLCSGQSNMAFGLSGCNRQSDIDSANYPALRQFTAPLANVGQPTKSITGSWMVCNPGNAASFSAVAFYFGRKICQDQSSAIPIGLFVTSVGGTCIDPWLAPEGCTDIPVLAPLYGQSILPWGPFCLFNGMVYPYSPLPAKGAIWYQGENRETTSQSTDSYYLKEKALQQGWKRLLGLDDFALYVVQLANYLDPPTTTTPDALGSWADTRQMQEMVANLAHGGVASAIDVGEQLDIHPKDKLDVGERLALWALKNDYGRSTLVTCGPVLKDTSVANSTPTYPTRKSIVCSFDSVGSGLMVGSKTAYLPTTEVIGGTLQKFVVADASGTWYAADAVINGNAVEVSSAAVTNPTKVAYAYWTNPAGANLYNRDGLPASPFYVDDVTAKFTVTASAGLNGSISPAGATTYLKRRTALYAITPNSGYSIQDVTVDGVSVGAVKSYTFDPLYAAHTIAATFAASAPNFTLSASASAGGTLSPSGAVSVAQGAGQTFTITPGGGAIIGLSVDGQPMGQRTSFAFADVRTNHTIAATFSFAINAQAGYGGTITPPGATVVTYGGNQTYDIVPLSGFTIAKVTVDGVNVGAGNSYTFNNVTVGHAITATFTGSGGTGSIPQTGNIYCSFLTDSLPASGTISSWASYLPSGKTLTQQNAPSVEVIDSRKFVKNVYSDSDCLNLGTIASSIPCAGATIMVVAKPTRFGTDGGWTSLVDIFYDRLVLGVMNGSGRVVVRRNGSVDTSTATIPDGQTTILSLVVQQDGTYKVYANGTQVMNITSTSNPDMSALVPGVAGTFANNITFGRNWPDGWTTYNGDYGDSFVYTTALSDAERVQLETYLVNRLTTTGTTYTITSSSGSGGTISPAGAVIVNAGGNQTFTIAPNTGYAIAGVTVDGSSVGAVASYAFNGVAANHTISATFAATGNTPPTISTVADQNIAANTSTAAQAFTVNDSETPVANLTVAAVSSNTTLVPNANIALGGSGGNRTVQVTPAANQTGTTTITLTVSDGTLTAPSSFALTVAAAGASKAISINVGYNGTLAATDIAGVIPVAHWNELSGAANNPSSSALVDESGNGVSGMTVSFQGNGNTFNNTGVADRTMLSGFLSGSPMSAQFTHIPFAIYDVYIYYAGFSSNYSLTWVATDTGTATVLGTQYSVRGTLAGPQLFPTPGLVQSQYSTLAAADAAASGSGGNWLRFSGLTATSLKIAETSANGNNENGFSGIQIVKTLATPTLAVANSPVTYNASPQAATINGSVAGTVGNVRYNGSATVPTAAGSYAITADFTPTDSANFSSLTAAAAGSLVIQKAPASVNLSGLSATCDGTPKAVSATTVPAGLAVTITYDGSATVPANAGSYAAVATVNDANYQGSASGTLLIMTQFAAWQGAHFTSDQISAGLAAENADPDHDGSNNLAEFAFNGDPRDPSSRGMFVTRLAGGSLTFTCAVRRGAVFSATAGQAQVSLTIDGLVYTIEGSADFAGAWNSSVSHQGVSDTAPAGSGLPALAGTGWQYHTFSAFNGLSGKGFLRARVATP